MADTSTTPGLGDLLNLMGGANPFGAIAKSIEQMRRGVTEFLAAVENFNQSMATINQVAQRANALFDDIEEPIRAMLPQVTRSIKTADAVINQLTGPVDRVAPGINRLADTLANPIFTTMPNDISSFVDAFGDLARRLQPLAQVAETAGGMFGFRSLLGGSPSKAADPPPPPPPAPAAAAAPARAKKAAAKKTATGKAAPRKAAGGKTAPRKAAGPRTRSG